jgi:hypothetical protein
MREKGMGRAAQRCVELGERVLNRLVATSNREYLLLDGSLDTAAAK